MIPQELAEEATALRERGFSCEIIEEGQRIFLFFKDFPLPNDLYNIEKTDLLIYTTNLYPNCGFDMFWVDNKLILKKEPTLKTVNRWKPTWAEHGDDLATTPIRPSPGIQHRIT